VRVRTASGPGSPAGQPRWGGGSDRIIFHLRFDIFHLVIHEHKLVMVRADKLANGEFNLQVQQSNSVSLQRSEMSIAMSARPKISLR